ncbi:hypothetical protein [Roseomonas elaeocarpi]|uniref:Uncharacterized protein n=1 Tax=Roseomonas elaeocarpi TaxID=907779 RepID=A0ABV6JU31_9PROT
MKSPLPLLPLLAALLAVPAAAQPPVVAPSEKPAPAVEEQPAGATTTLSLEQPGGGNPREYQLEDLSFSISRGMDPRGEGRGDVSIAAGSPKPMDAFLLQWLRQGNYGPEASRKVVITVSVPQPSGAPTVMRYQLDEARVVSLTLNYSGSAGIAQTMLQISARQVTLDGIVLN